MIEIGNMKDEIENVMNKVQEAVRMGAKSITEVKSGETNGHVKPLTFDDEILRSNNR